MKEFILVLLWFGFSLKSIAQKDKTLTWLAAQHGEAGIQVSNHSIKVGDNFYEQYLIAPNQLKTLHIHITASYLNETTFNTPFAIEVKNRKQDFGTKIINSVGFFKTNINLTLFDTIAINCIVPPNNNDATKFNIEYTIGDTAELDYSNKKPQQVFERMLELCATGFTNFCKDDGHDFSSIYYDKGLFADFKAERKSIEKNVTQPTSKRLNTENEATNIYDEWNTKITNWLKEFNITNVKKFTLKSSRHKKEEITAYTKKNNAGQILFVVEVFKEINNNNILGNYFETGVRIAQKESESAEKEYDINKYGMLWKK